MTKDFDTNDLTRRYLAGESLADLGKSLGVCSHTIRARLRKLGVPLRSLGEANRLALEKPVPVEEVARRYLAGECPEDLARAFGVCRLTITRKLQKAGVPLRGYNQAQALLSSRRSPEERARLAEFAHAALRGRPQGLEQRLKIAAAREARGEVNPTEQVLLDLLASKVGPLKPQKAVGPYNVDLALTESRIAVDIFGGNWHASGRHARRFRKRSDHILNEGWCLVIIWVSTRFPLTEGAAEHLIALHERRCRKKSACSQEQVIGGNGHVVPVGESDPNNGSFKLGYNPGNPTRGPDGRYAQAAVRMQGRMQDRVIGRPIVRNDKRLVQPHGFPVQLQARQTGIGTAKPHLLRSP